ncbi:MAG TPA: T9SS type A sorting domain-containing protein [Bacteroidales bacterium]|nr:T9SS type A sorting domain-containing protein [Bacteroidales bacterium]HSA43044.1 T9SS type A sorting domain-containing protein [Bacteroidales bacterium]
MKKFIILLTFSFVFSVSYSQTPALTLPHVTGVNAGDTVLVPLTGQDIYNWSSLALEVSFWNTVVFYTGYTVFHPDLNNGNTMINHYIGGATDQLLITWFGLTPFTADGDTLYLLKFYYLGGYTPLTITPLPNIITNSGSIGGGVGIPDIGNTQVRLNPYPNPVPTGKALSLSGEPGSYELTLTSPDGRIALSQAVEIASHRTYPLCTAGLKPGLYLIRLRNTKNDYSGRTIIIE